jgi:serine/threonine-protein kinase
MGVEGLQGTRVGRYLLQECLGHSRYTAVYQAASSAGERCAIKLVDSHLLGGEDLAERLRRESAVLNQIRHPRIIPIRDSMASEEMTAAVMPLLLAPSLKDLMWGRRLESELAWAMLSQVADALHAAHSAGLVYRLLKPANILISDGQAYLAEFGIAGRSTGQVALAGQDGYPLAAQYLAPEQVLGHEADVQADLYAFAVLAFELATGTPLYDGVAPPEILRSALSGPPPTAYTWNPRIPREVDMVLRRALDRDPGRRHPTIRHLIDELVCPPEIVQRPADRTAGQPLLPGPRPPSLPASVPRHPVLPQETPRFESEAASSPMSVESLIDVLSGVLGNDPGNGQGPAPDSEPPRR